LLQIIQDTPCLTSFLNKKRRFLFWSTNRARSRRLTWASIQANWFGGSSDNMQTIPYTSYLSFELSAQGLYLVPRGVSSFTFCIALFMDWDDIAIVSLMIVIPKKLTSQDRQTLLLSWLLFSLSYYRALVFQHVSPGLICNASFYPWTFFTSLRFISVLLPQNFM